LEIVSDNEKEFCKEKVDTLLKLMRMESKRQTQHLTIDKQKLRQKCVTGQLLPI
jgi:hypothetical protein